MKSGAIFLPPFMRKPECFGIFPSPIAILHVLGEECILAFIAHIGADRAKLAAWQCLADSACPGRFVDSFRVVARFFEINEAFGIIWGALSAFFNNLG